MNLLNLLPIAAVFIFSANGFGMVILGDVNQDGEINLLDVSPFVDAISSGEYQIAADMNEDGAVDLLDVSVFIDVLAGLAPKIAVLKDTLDPANFQNIGAGGAFIEQDPVNSSEQDGRAYLGFDATGKGFLRDLTFNFIAIAQGSGEPVDEPGFSGLFDLNIGHYDSLQDAESDELRVDAFFPMSTQPNDIFQNPVGQTGDGVVFGQANVFQAKYNLLDAGLAVVPGQTITWGFLQLASQAESRSRLKDQTIPAS